MYHGRTRMYSWLSSLASLFILVTIILTRHSSMMAVSMKRHYNDPHIPIVYYYVLIVPHFHDYTFITLCLTVLAI